MICENIAINHCSDGSLILNNRCLAVRVYPWLGGKITEILHLNSGFQPVFQSSAAFQKPYPYAPFPDFDTSGLDDAFPTIIEEAIFWDGRQINLPDHGEIWSTALDCAETGQGLHLTMDSAILPYRYEKAIQLDDQSVLLSYKIQNTGNADIPCHWTFHGLMRYEEDMQFLFPRGAKEVLNVLDSRLLGAMGTRYDLPVGSRDGLPLWDFRTVPPRSPPSQEKFWLTEPVEEGLCGIRYPGAGMEVLLEYDPQKLPYLGCWIDAGRFKGEYNCALEPSNGYYDSVGCALENNRCPILKAGSPWTFTVKIMLHKININKEILNDTPPEFF